MHNVVHSTVLYDRKKSDLQSKCPLIKERLSELWCDH